MYQRSVQASFSLYHVPLLILDIFFLQVYVSDKRSAGWNNTNSKKVVLKMSLELLQGGVFVAAIIADTFERIYVGYRVGWWLFLMWRDDIRRGFDKDVSHCNDSWFERNSAQRLFMLPYSSNGGLKVRM